MYRVQSPRALLVRQQRGVKFVLHPPRKGALLKSCALPPHIEPKALAKALKMPPGELCQHARSVYKWYPTEDDIRRVGYASNQVILSFREAERVAARAGITVALDDPLAAWSAAAAANKADVRPRPALLSVMGHANHGKTSLLGAPNRIGKLCCARLAC